MKRNKLFNVPINSIEVQSRAVSSAVNNLTKKETASALHFLFCCNHKSDSGNKGFQSGVGFLNNIGVCIRMLQITRIISAQYEALSERGRIHLISKSDKGFTYN